MTKESWCSINRRHPQPLSLAPHIALFLLLVSWPSGKCHERGRPGAPCLLAFLPVSGVGSARRGTPTPSRTYPLGTSGLKGLEAEPFTSSCPAASTRTRAQGPPGSRPRAPEGARTPARAAVGPGRAISLPRGVLSADRARGRLRSLPVIGLAAPPGPPLPGPPRGPQFPRPCQLASGQGSGPRPPGLGLTGRRGTISTEQQWQKYRPGCGDASAMATAASSAPPAPRAAPAAGRLLLPRRPTSPRTLTHGTHGTHGVRRGRAAETGQAAREAGGGSGDGGRRGAN